MSICGTSSGSSGAFQLYDCPLVFVSVYEAEADGLDTKAQASISWILEDSDKGDGVVSAEDRHLQKRKDRHSNV